MKRQLQAMTKQNSPSGPRWSWDDGNPGSVGGFGDDGPVFFVFFGGMGSQ